MKNEPLIDGSRTRGGAADIEPDHPEKARPPCGGLEISIIGGLASRWRLENGGVPFIEIATNRPVTIVPISRPPTVRMAAPGHMAQFIV